MTPEELYPLTRQHDIDHLAHNYIDLKFSNDQYTEFTYRDIIICVYADGTIGTGSLTMPQTIEFIDKYLDKRSCEK